MNRVLLLASAAVGGMMLAATTAEAQSGPFDWSGFYAGIHGGVVNGNVKITDGYDTWGTFNGPIAGFLAGYNFPMSPLSPNVLGVEADIGWANAGSNSSVLVAPGAQYEQIDGCVDYYDYNLRWDAHGRVIAGVPLGAWMPFIAGGIAIADLNLGSECERYTVGGIYVGGTLGAGINVKLSPRVTARGEFLYDIYPTKQYEDFAANFTAWTFRAALMIQLP